MEVSRASKAEPTALPDDAFFIPNLCTPQAVLLAVLLAELVVLLHVLALGPLVRFDWRSLATGSFFVQWNTLLCVALICHARGWLSRWSPGPATATAVCLALVLIISIASSVLIYRFYPLLWPAAGGLGDWVLRNALLALTLAAIVLRYSYLQQRIAMQQRSELQLRLDALRARIRPHFLFNTLNSIASLIAVQPDRAEQAIEDVAELFRAALTDAPYSSLGDEIHLCRLYLDIEQLRFGERLDVRWEIQDSLDQEDIPALLLQPLVENAVYHGIALLPTGGQVSVRTYADDACLVLEVENPLPQGVSASSSSGHRMALDNIRQRLDAQYGEQASLKVGQTGQTYLARIVLPLGGAVTEP
ncbi:MAG: sensor histidine kinase [Congregibacter sp.]